MRFFVRSLMSGSERKPRKQIRSIKDYKDPILTEFFNQSAKNGNNSTKGALRVGKGSNP